MSDLPPCGLYRTTQPLAGDVPAGRLVYFHNHGSPGPGIYLPRAWVQNRAQWHERGFSVPDDAYARTLSPLNPEGFYRVAQAFFCCDRRCREFEAGTLAQLGYDGEGTAILFLPELTAEGLRIPERGQVVDASRLGGLELLKVARPAPIDGPRGLMH